MSDQPFVRFDLAGAEELKAFLSKVAADDLPYVVALGFWRIAKHIVKQGEVTLRQNFTIRSQWVLKSWSSFTPSGSSAEPTGAIFEMKRDWPNTAVVVGHRDAYMALQEKGGVKLPDASKNRTFIAIPTRLTWAQRTRSGAIPRALADYRLLQEQLARLASRPDAGATVSVVRSKAAAIAGLLRRQQKGFEKRGLEILFLRRPLVGIRPRAGLFAMAQREFNARAPAEFEAAWQRALTTRHGRA